MNENINDIKHKSQIMSLKVDSFLSQGTHKLIWVLIRWHVNFFFLLSLGRFRTMIPFV